MTDLDALRERSDAVFALLSPLWPDTRPLLDYGSCFELLCAVVLSAQCTDEQVNRVTPGLFARWPDAFALAKAETGEVEAEIRSVGFYKTKARHLVAAAALLVERHGGLPPASMEELLALPGVGRKTANLLLSACFGQPGIIVDTHVQRVVRRLGLYPKADPAKIEERIAALVPPERRTAYSHALNRHGKYVCTARKPHCPSCALERLCPKIGVANKGPS